MNKKAEAMQERYNKLFDRANKAFDTEKTCYFLSYCFGAMVNDVDENSGAIDTMEMEFERRLGGKDES